VEVVAAGPIPAVGPSEGSAILGRRALARTLDFGLGVGMFFAFSYGVAAAGGPSEDGTGVFLIAVVSTFLAYFAYEVLAVAIWGRTLGKLAFGVRVVRADTGGRPGLFRGLKRNLVPTAALYIFPLYPVAWMLELGGHDQWPNDWLAGTEVVRA
jgi:uncharacterized RDD family membrane protein YckC